MFLWLCGRHDKAREYVERMLKMSPTSKDGLTLRGWIDLTSGRETLMKRSLKYFEEALAGLVYYSKSIIYTRGRKESVILRIAAYKHTLKSTKVKLHKTYHKRVGW